MDPDAGAEDAHAEAGPAAGPAASRRCGYCGRAGGWPNKRRAGIAGASRSRDATDALFEAAASGTASEVKVALSAGADPGARDDAGKAPFDYAKNNEALKGTDAYWLLNEARFE